MYVVKLYRIRWCIISENPPIAPPLFPVQPVQALKVDIAVLRQWGIGAVELTQTAYRSSRPKDFDL